MWVSRGCAANVVTYKVCGMQVLSASHIRRNRAVVGNRMVSWLQSWSPFFHSPGHRLLLARKEPHSERNQDGDSCLGSPGLISHKCSGTSLHVGWDYSECPEDAI